MNSRLLALGGVARVALRTVLLALPLTLAATGAVDAGGVTGQRISEAGPSVPQTVWRSGGEMVSQLMNCASSYVPVLQVTIPSVQAGQTLTIDADMEATDNYTTTGPMLASYVTINGQGVDYPQASNVSPDMHHMTVTRAAIWEAKSNMQNVVVQLVARACDDTLSTYVPALQVNYGYGTVFVYVH